MVLLVESENVITGLDQLVFVEVFRPEQVYLRPLTEALTEALQYIACARVNDTVVFCTYDVDSMNKEQRAVWDRAIEHAIEHGVRVIGVSPELALPSNTIIENPDGTYTVAAIQGARELAQTVRALKIKRLKPH